MSLKGENTNSYIFGWQVLRRLMERLGQAVMKLGLWLASVVLFLRRQRFGQHSKTLSPKVHLIQVTKEMVGMVHGDMIF
jgi:hypothetical protein